MEKQQYLKTKKRNNSHFFNLELTKLAKIYKECNQNLREAVRVYKELYRWAKPSFVQSLAEQLSQDLTLEGDYKELIRDFNETYKAAYEITKDTLFKDKDPTKVLYVMSEWQKSLNIRKPNQVNVNSGNTVTNSQTNININPKIRMSDLPLDVQKALQTIAKSEVPKLESNKTKVDIPMSEETLKENPLEGFRLGDFEQDG